jgi:hypothetical protein
MNSKSLGEAFATDDDVPAIKPRSRAARKQTGHDRPVDPVHSEKVYITLEDNEAIPPTGQFFGINGRTYVLKPGIPAAVPREILNILNDAQMDVPQMDPSTQQVIGYRKRLRFPYRMSTKQEADDVMAAL